MSTTATSGGSSATACSRPSASPTARTTAKPRSDRSCCSPSRRMAESSAITTRIASASGTVTRSVGRSTVTTVGPPGGAGDAQVPVDRPHPVGQAGQAARRGPDPVDRRPPHPVVAHDDAQPRAVLRTAERRPRRTWRAGRRWPAVRRRRSSRSPRWPGSAGHRRRPCTSVGIVERAARVASAFSSPVSRAGGWMPRARSRRSVIASLAPRCASSTRRRTASRSAARRIGVDVLQLAPSPGRVAWRGPPAAPGCRRGDCARCAGASPWRRRASSSSTPRGSAPGRTWHWARAAGASVAGRR